MDLSFHHDKPGNTRRMLALWGLSSPHFILPRAPPHMARCCLWLPPIFHPYPWEGATPETALSSLRDLGQHRLMEPAVGYLLYPSLLPNVVWLSTQA